jgi:hypothetical protein
MQQNWRPSFDECKIEDAGRCMKILTPFFVDMGTAVFQLVVS